MNEKENITYVYKYGDGNRNKITLIYKMIAFLFIIESVIFMTVTSTEDKTMYTTKYDNIDIDSIIQNQRLLKNYIGCLMEENPCTPDGIELKKNLPDALATNCSSCSPAQKLMAEKMYHHLIDNRPDDWDKLEMKYDPSGTYKKHYLEMKIFEATKESSTEVP